MEQVTENTEEEGREPGNRVESGLLWDPVELQVSLHCRLKKGFIIFFPLNLSSPKKYQFRTDRKSLMRKVYELEHCVSNKVK